MTAPDPIAFALRLYGRLPGHYRQRDAERNLPLLALLRVIGTQAANLRQDLDDLWDDFFIETCDDWVVPYLGALLGTRLLANPVGQSSRLDVWNTVAWRRSRGTPRMLQSLSPAIAGWPAGLAEFFKVLGWSQSMNHRRLTALLTPDLRESFALSQLGTADDPWLHAADFKPSADLDQPPVVQGSLGMGVAAYGTGGRYQIRTLGLFASRLQVFPVTGVTPGTIAPGLFTFDPLARDLPLFAESSTLPITRADLAGGAVAFGTDLAVRCHGVALATATGGVPSLVSSNTPASFGVAGAGLTLDAAAGMRLLSMDATTGRGGDFIITAAWEHPDLGLDTLGVLGTRPALLGYAAAFQAMDATSDVGVLILTISLADLASAWPPPAFSPPHAGHFPGAVIGLRAAQSGALRQSDGLIAALPEAVIRPGSPLTLWVADDGSTYTDRSLAIETLARSGEGQVYPPFAATPSTVAALDQSRLSRGPGGLALTDPSRFGGAGVLFTAEIYTGVPQRLGAIASIDLSGALIPELDLPPLWPALTFAPDPYAPDIDGILSILVQPISAMRVPPTELIVTNRAGAGLLVYLPDIDLPPAAGVRFLIAADGSSFFYPADDTAAQAALATGSLGQLVLARAAAGQVWPIAGLWPLQQRIAVAWSGLSALVPGQLGVDPERGRFSLPDGDPALGSRLSADYAEGFSDRVGALNFDRQTDPSAIATRLVSASGDAEPGLSALSDAPVHLTLADALAAASDGEIIEIADSATYAEPAPVPVGPAISFLTIRARQGCRPCLTFAAPDGTPLPASLVVANPMTALTLSGLLVSGGPLTLHAPVLQLQITGCTLIASPTQTGLSLIADAPASGQSCAILLCRCIAGVLCLGAAVDSLVVADSILDAGGGFAIVGTEGLGSPPFSAPWPTATPASVQLERVTVLGRVFCNSLSASESLLDGIAIVEDQQSGCIRFSRTETGSILPRRYRCVPTEDQTTAWSGTGRLLAPTFNGRRVGRAAYAQLASTCPAEIRTASEAGAEIGAFAARLDSVRLANLRTKLAEFMPVGLQAAIIAVT